MRRGLHAAAAVIAVSTGVAHAGGGHTVMVDSEPAGAHVYLNDTESPAVCDKTPCSFEAPAGDYSIIVELQNYAPDFQTLEIPKRPKKPLVVHAKLKPAIATIVIDSAAAKGASITIDGESKGKVNGSGSAKVDVEPGGHQITVTLAGKNLFEDFVDVDAGQEVPLNLKVAAAPPAPGDGAKPDGDATPPPHEETSIVATPAEPFKRNRFISGDVIVDVGFRRFSYVNPKAGDPLFYETEDGQVIGGPAIEFWPMELLHIDHLRGLSLFAKIEVPINNQDVLNAPPPPQQPMKLGSTKWLSAEVSVRQGWTFGDMGGLEVKGGYVRETLGFDADSAELQKLPDADYQSIQLGARASLNFGAVEPYVSFEERFVQDGGALATRFQTSSVDGFRATVGIAARGGSFIGRVEASDAHYDWKLSQASQPGLYSADAATDKILAIAFSLGYQY